MEAATSLHDDRRAAVQVERLLEQILIGAINIDDRDPTLAAGHKPDAGRICKLLDQLCAPGETNPSKSRDGRLLLSKLAGLLIQHGLDGKRYDPMRRILRLHLSEDSTH